MVEAFDCLKKSTLYVGPYRNAINVGVGQNQTTLTFIMVKRSSRDGVISSQGSVRDNETAHRGARHPTYLRLF